MDTYLPDVLTSQDYYAFGSVMPGRGIIGSNAYRYGFNGQEKNDEISGNGNNNTAEFWQYDARLGRRWNVDPVLKPNESPYLCFGGNPTWNVDPKGNDWYKNNKTGTVVWVETQSGREIGGYTYLGEHRYLNYFSATENYEYFNFLGRGNEAWFADQAMFGSNDGANTGGSLGGTYGYNHGGKDLMINTMVTVGTLSLGETVLGAKSIWAYLGWETSTKVIAARGDLTKVDWFDVLTGVIAKKLGVTNSGVALGIGVAKDVLNSMVDAKISDGEIKMAFVNKDNSKIFMDITFSGFKQMVGKIGETTGATKLSQEQMKMLFDQLKT